LEFASGRPLHHAFPLAWQRLREIMEAAYQARAFADAQGV